MKNRFATFSIATLLLALTVFVIPAQAVTVTETDVFPTSTQHFPQNKQNESPMAVNPIDPNNIITGANDEIEEPDCTPATGGSSSCPFVPGIDLTGVYWTTDGGTTWNHQILPWFSQIGHASDGDPVVAFGPMPDSSAPKGFSYGMGARAYFGSLASSPFPLGELLAVAHSDNKGATWSTPVLATTKDNPVDFNDKIAIWADANPSSPFFGNVYVSWTLFIGPPAHAEPIAFARSTDGGQTFQPTQKLTPAYNSPARPGRQGSVVRTGPDGTVYVFWEDSFTRQSVIRGARSLDGGATFSRPFFVANVNDLPSPFPGASFRTNSFPMVDVDQSAGTFGRLFIVWGDFTSGTTSGHSVVKIAISSNGGSTWTVSTAADVTSRSAFYPAVAVDPTDGTKVFIGFNAIDDETFGTAPGAGVVSYDAYYVLSTDSGSSFGAPVKISAAPSDPDSSSTNSLRTQFLGDYNGASASSAAAWFSWTDSRNGATCTPVDTFRAGTATKPNIYDSCPMAFGNTDIFVAEVTWT